MKNTKALTDSEIKIEISGRLRGKTAIVGVGNIIRGDDGLGPKLIEVLKQRGLAKAALFDCGTVPENYIFPILSAACDTIVLVDAADTNELPGSIGVFGLEDISGVSFSTHNPSPRLFTDLLKTGNDNMNIFVVTVQPKSTGVGEPLSAEVLSSLDKLAGIFIKNIK